MEEYLTVKELSYRIKFSKQSLYNLIHKETFILGKHYLKPTPKKVLFKWSEICTWLGEPAYLTDKTAHGHYAYNLKEDTIKLEKPEAKNLINI